MMIKPGLLIPLYLNSLLLLGCNHNPVILPALIQDAVSFTHAGVQAFVAADRNRAKHWFNRALSIYKGIDHQKGLLETRINLAEVALSERDYPATQQHLQHATKSVDSTTLHPYQARISLLYAQTALKQKHYSQALTLLQSLLPEFKETASVGVPDAIQLTAIANRTHIAFAQKQNETLWTHRYTHAVHLSGQGNPHLTGRLLRFQAQLALHKKKYLQAEILLQLALTEYKKNLAQTGIAATLSELGQLHMTQEHWQEARNYLERSKDILYFIHHIDTLIRVTQWLVTVELKLGHFERSQALNEWLTGIENQ